MVYNDFDSRRQASEAIKDLMVSEKRSKLPLILGTLVVLGLLGAGGYWYMLPPNQRPDFQQLQGRAVALVNKMLNSPVMSPAQPAPSNPASPAAPATNNKNPASSSSENTGLLSN